MVNFKKQKGITLIALVVTIIVLIILAGVSVNLILGQNGLITKSREAKTTYEAAANIEHDQMVNVEKIFGELTGESASTYTVIYDANGGTGTIPNGTGKAIIVSSAEGLTIPEGITIPMNCGPVKLKEWNTKQDGSGTSYQPGDIIEESTTLYAQWAVQCTIKFNLRPSTTTLEDIETFLGEKIVLPDPHIEPFTKNGYDYQFKGWEIPDAFGGSGHRLSAGSSYTVEYNCTIDPWWDESTIDNIPPYDVVSEPMPDITIPAP